MFDDYYVKWRKKRIIAIANFFGHEFFAGKKILEIGCGFGDIGKAFEDMGATVTFVDARPEHLKKVKQISPHSRIIKADFDQQWPFKETFDITLHLGTLNHLRYIDAHLAEVCQSSRYLVLDTQVCDSIRSECHLVKENNRNYDQSFNGIGCKPSTAYIENLLSKNGMEFTRILDDRCNEAHYVYDWQEQNTKSYKDGLSRFWFAKRHGVDIGTLTHQFSNQSTVAPVPNLIKAEAERAAAVMEYTIPSPPSPPSPSSPSTPARNAIRSINPNVHARPILNQKAICIFGDLNNFQEIYTSIRNVEKEEGKPADVFVHCWTEGKTVEARQIFSPAGMKIESRSTWLSQNDSKLEYLYQMSQAIQLKEDFETNSGHVYSKVVIVGQNCLSKLPEHTCTVVVGDQYPTVSCDSINADIMKLCIDYIPRYLKSVPYNPTTFNRDMIEEHIKYFKIPKDKI